MHWVSRTRLLWSAYFVDDVIVVIGFRVIIHPEEARQPGPYLIT